MSISTSSKIMDVAQAFCSSTVMHRFPLCAGPLGFSGNDYMVVQMADQYYKLGQPEKARELAVAFGDELMQSIMFYMQFYEYARSDFETSVNYLYFLVDFNHALRNRFICGRVFCWLSVNINLP